MKRFEVTVTIDDALLDDVKAKGDVNKYVSELIENDLTKIIRLENGFYYNQAAKVLYNSFDKEVKLTRIESALFEVLFRAGGDTVKIDDIHKGAWKGKNMTRFTLRNKVNTIRSKTYYDLIKNHSNIGYSMEGISK